MNRLQNSIVRFLKHVIDFENLIILLNIGQSILHSRQVPSIVFFFFFAGSHWIVIIVYLSRNGWNLKLLLLLFYYHYYFIPIYVATEHKSHSNLTIQTYKPEDNLNMNKTCAKYKRFSIWIIPHWRRIQTSLLDPAPLGTAVFRCHAVIYLPIGRCESRMRYFRDGKLIIGAAKLIDLDNYMKIFRGYFTKYIHASTLFLFNTNISVWKQMHI